jgi:hypothetical protein
LQAALDINGHIHLIVFRFQHAAATLTDAELIVDYQYFYLVSHHRSKAYPKNYNVSASKAWPSHLEGRDCFVGYAASQ